MSVRVYRRAAMIGLLSACAMWAPAALAQDTAESSADGESSGLAEIVVTAQKRAENLQNTPISLAAMTAGELERRGIADITDLRSSVPALQVTPHPNSATTARVFIRGVGNNDDQITADPSVALYIDGVYVARSQGLSAEVAEVERVEVLRGPQGSLYGRNATGGAINYITRAPELGQFSAKQTLSYGNYNQFRARTRINVPLGDNLAVELGYLHSQKDGFVRNAGTGVERWGDQRRDAYRAAVRWQPVSTVDLRYTYDRSDIGDTPVFIAAVPLYPARAPRPTTGSALVRDLKPNDVTSQGHTLTASWDTAEHLTIRSITGYRKLTNTINQNYFTGVVGAYPLILNATDSTQDQFSEELQAVGSALDGRLEYVLGGYYFNESADSYDTSNITGVRNLARTVTIKNRAYAVFGQATVRPAFLEGLYLTGGLRWSRDERKATLQQVTTPAGGSAVTSPTGKGDRAFSNVSPSFTIGFEPSKDVNLYAKYAKGYKTGGYNVRASTIARFEDGFGEETLDSFEVGMKSTWLDNHLRFNIAGFVSSYDGIQTNVQADPLVPGITNTFNAGKATIKGLEMDLTAQPTRGLTVNLNYAYLDAGYDRIIDPANGADITSRYTYIQAPEHTVTAGVRYEFPETPLGVLTASVDYFMQSKKFTNTNDPRYIVGDYGLLDARLTLSEIPVGFGKWRLSAYGKNLTDQVYYADHFNSILPSAIFGDPRSYGIELTAEF
jgi:iron complex outermembrane receptor protein